MRIAYYNWRNDNKWRRLRDMKEDLCKSAFEWRFHNSVDETWIAVGDKKLIEVEDYPIAWGASLWDDPTFNSYTAALEWLKGEEEMPVTNSFDVIKTDISDQGLSFSIDVKNNDIGLEFFNKKYLTLPTIKRIEQNVKNGTIYTTVLWDDGSDATVVKCAEEDTNDLYFAVASAIAIKLHGSNSAFKRMIDDKADIQEEKPTEFSFEVSMNNFADSIRKAFTYKGGIHND